MKIGNKSYRTIWPSDDGETIHIIDQRFLPHELVIADLQCTKDFVYAIREMQVRGAPLIGVTAAYGMYIALKTGDDLNQAYEALFNTRPTASNLKWALDQQVKLLDNITNPVEALLNNANRLADEDIATCKNIGEYGLQLIETIAKQKPKQPVNILTHCNAGWLATIDYGTATAPIYLAHDKGIPVHVWVDETRPRNQGANLTAFELKEHGVPHTVITDNAGGHIMQHGLVDLCITGTDRTTANGDVCNKIGTYLKALAAKDNNVPFYVALPSSTIDWNLNSGSEIPIEQRSPDEVHFIHGKDDSGRHAKVRITPDGSPAANYAFDVTPAHLVTGLITEKGICEASKEGLAVLFDR